METSSIINLSSDAQASLSIKSIRMIAVYKNTKHSIHILSFVLSPASYPFIIEPKFADIGALFFSFSFQPFQERNDNKITAMYIQ